MIGSRTYAPHAGRTYPDPQRQLVAAFEARLDVMPQRVITVPQRHRDDRLEDPAHCPPGEPARQFVAELDLHLGRRRTGRDEAPRRPVPEAADGLERNDLVL